MSPSTAAVTVMGIYRNEMMMIIIIIIMIIIITRKHMIAFHIAGWKSQ
jgi:hypothetical protein